MPDIPEFPFPPLPARDAAHPLAGLTVMVVEDSRFASEAVRLLCLRSGARLRRADCLRAAERHLCVYRPSVIIVDLGLPDGSGLDLIERLSAAEPRIPAIIATSGDEHALDAALDAGADAILAKPLGSLALFQETVLSTLPPDHRISGPRPLPSDMVTPDQLALTDDLSRATELMSGEGDARSVRYLAHFLTGVALSAHDPALADAARRLERQHAAGHPVISEMERVAGMVQDRLDRSAAL